MNLDDYKDYSAPILRIGVSIVFLWFGFNQVFDPNYFISYLPAFVYQLPFSVISFVMFNGILELILGGLLIAGMYTRVVAFLLGLHLLAITISLGYNEIAVRDLGLTIATFAVMLNGKDKWSLKN